MDEINEILNYIIKYYDSFDLSNDLDILDFLQHYGFSTNLSKLELNKDIISIKNKIKHIKHPLFINNKKYFNLKYSKDFLNLYFKLHNIKNPNLGFISPFELPVLHIDESFQYGGLIHGRNANEKESNFHTLLLSKRKSILTPIIYAHEIIHTQLFSTYGSINNYYNMELLPIFIEYLYLYTFCDKEIFDNLLKLHTYSRFKYLLSQINTIEKYQGSIDTIEDICYFISTISAYKLFYTYNSSTNITQNYIINRIQNIFDGNYQLEELIDEFNINTKLLKKEKH